MADQQQKPFDDANMQQRAFSRWENEGGATGSGHEKPATKISNTENMEKTHNPETRQQLPNL